MKIGRKTGSETDSGSAASGETMPKIGKLSVGKPKQKPTPRGYLDGQMLIAMPSMGDERFSRSLIYVCAHSSEGAMGIVVNQPAAHITFPDLLVKLDVIPKADKIQLPVSYTHLRAHE